MFNSAHIISLLSLMASFFDDGEDDDDNDVDNEFRLAVDVVEADSHTVTL